MPTLSPHEGRRGLITRVVLKNFQSHKVTDLELGNLTTFTGGSNSGKSAVLRAIAGLLRNDSVGDFVTHGETALSVKMFFADGHAVEWVKGGGENAYYITTPDGDIQEFSKVGADVPVEVADILRLTPILMESGEKVHLNLHPQLDSPFLVADTPGYVAKVFGELTSVSKLYAAVAEGNRVSRSKNSLRRTRKDDLNGLTEKLREFPDHDYYEGLWKEARQAWSDNTAYGASIDTIKEICAEIVSAKEKISGIDLALDNIQTAASTDLEELSDVQARLTQLTGIATDLSTKDSYLAQSAKVIAEYDGVSEVDLDVLTRANDALASLDTVRQNLEQVEDEYGTLGAAIARQETLAGNLKLDIDELMETLTSCPSCLQGLDENSKLALIEGETHVAC